MKNVIIPPTKIAVFRKKEVRKAIHNNEWWFSITDVIEVITGIERPRKYWNDLKKKLVKEGYFEVSEKIGQLKMQYLRINLWMIR
jgi:DNA-damage-inducible protein D